MVGTASMKREGSGSHAVGPVLPEVFMVWEILVRLPAKALLRCRAVCRSWRRLTSENAFLLAHHRRQPFAPAGHSTTSSPDDESSEHSPAAVFDASLDTVDLRRSPSERQPVLHFDDYNADDHAFWIHCSCDGLLLLSLSDKDFYLCNPATRQWTPLPHLTGADGAVLYPHTSSGEYPVIYWKGKRYEYVKDRKVIYDVHILDSSAEPRRIEASTPHAMRLVEAGWFHLSYLTGVKLRGCLHGSSEKFLMVFDTVAESFRSMPSPVAAKYMTPQLFEMDATLAVSWIDNSQTVMKLWVLQDYETGVWSLKRWGGGDMEHFTVSILRDGGVSGGDGGVSQWQQQW